MNDAELYQTATRLQQAGQWLAAEQAYQAYLQQHPTQAEGWLRLGILYYRLERYGEAEGAIARTLALNPGSPTAYVSQGLIRQKLGQMQGAIAAYQQALKLDPTLSLAHYQLGMLWQQQGDLDQALQSYQQALQQDPNADTYMALGAVKLAQQDWQGAIVAYRQALQLRPRHPDILWQIGSALAGQGDLTLAYNYWGYACYRRSDHEAAIPHFARWFEVSLTQPWDAELEFVNDVLVYVHCLNESGQTEVAIACLTQAQTRSRHLALELRQRLLLPLIYADVGAIAHYRDRFQQGLATLIAQTPLETAAERLQALDATNRQTNFYLCFQGENDRALQAEYGQWLHRIMAANYPDWVEPRPLSPRRQGKIRIGYLSEAFGSTSATRWVLGWLERHNRDQFEIYCYHTGEQTNPQLATFQQHSDQFRHLPGSLEAIAPQILQDDLHILVFLALGLWAPTLQLAALRLAPIQCSAWGHPVTSGLPTVDYYLSGELLEPANAQDHYTEQLIRLPNLGLAYPAPQIPPATKQRSDFQLRSDAVVYVSCQLLFKYLPQHDQLLAAIARQVPQAQFVFIVRSNSANQVSPSLLHQFQHRLDQAFAAVGLNRDEFCVFLPGEDWAGYTSLLLSADVFLDTLEFSGGHTTFDAIACQLPIVTQAGGLMRGRQSSAILQRAGVPETIARTAAEYVEIAVRLGQDPEWRRAIAQKLAQASHLYNDPDCVIGLEAFYRQLIP